MGYIHEEVWQHGENKLELEPMPKIPKVQELSCRPGKWREELFGKANMELERERLRRGLY